MTETATVFAIYYPGENVDDARVTRVDEPFAGFLANLPDDAHAFEVRAEADLIGVPNRALLVIYNRVEEKPVKRFSDARAAARRVFPLLMAAAEADGPPNLKKEPRARARRASGGASKPRRDVRYSATTAPVPDFAPGTHRAIAYDGAIAGKRRSEIPREARYVLAWLVRAGMLVEVEV